MLNWEVWTLFFMQSLDVRNYDAIINYTEDWKDHNNRRLISLKAAYRSRAEIGRVSELHSKDPVQAAEGILNAIRVLIDLKKIYGFSKMFNEVTYELVREVAHLNDAGGYAIEDPEKFMLLQQLCDLLDGFDLELSMDYETCLDRISYLSTIQTRLGNPFRMGKWKNALAGGIPLDDTARFMEAGYLILRVTDAPKGYGAFRYGVESATQEKFFLPKANFSGPPNLWLKVRIGAYVAIKPQPRIGSSGYYRVADKIIVSEDAL